MDRDPWCLPRSVVFSRDKKAGEIDRALPVLEDATAAARHTRDGGGRPVYANRPKGERTDDYYVRTGNSTRQLTRSRSSTTPRRAGRGDRRYETDCGRVLGHNGGIPGFLNDLYSSEDGTHQFGLMINAEAAPQAVGQP